MPMTLKKEAGAARLRYKGETYVFDSPDRTLVLDDERLGRELAREHREVQVVKQTPKKEATTVKNTSTRTKKTSGGDAL